MWDKVKGILGAVAPVLGTAVGGPLGGVAARALSGALLGRPDGTEAEIVSALGIATPEQLAALKQAEHDFKVQMKQLDVDLEKIHAADRDSARRRQVEMRDWTPALLGAGITAGFFGVLGYMLAHGVPQTGGEALLVMLGALGAAWGAVVNYYFGSSAGSAEKDKLFKSSGA